MSKRSLVLGAAVLALMGCEPVFQGEGNLITQDTGVDVGSSDLADAGMDATEDEVIETCREIADDEIAASLLRVWGGCAAEEPRCVRAICRVRGVDQIPYLNGAPICKEEVDIEQILRDTQCACDTLGGDLDAWIYHGGTCEEVLGDGFGEDVYGGYVESAENLDAVEGYDDGAFRPGENEDAGNNENNDDADAGNIDTDADAG